MGHALALGHALFSALARRELLLLGCCLFLSGLTPLSEVIALRISRDTNCNYGDLRVWGSVGFLVAVLLYGTLIDAFGKACNEIDRELQPTRQNCCFPNTKPLFSQMPSDPQQ